KLRDEQNTFRLVRRWHERIARLAARDWARHFVEQHWDHSFVYDYALGREALAYWFHLVPFVPAGVDEGVRYALAHELSRWQSLCGVPGFEVITDQHRPREVPPDSLPAR